jgi:NADP-dependent alcohol dehydrogenase
MWAATMALNGLINVGVKQDWSTHIIGHELTAFHGLDHAITLAIVLPGVLNIKKIDRKEKLLQYAQRVWGITEGSEEEKLNMAIEKTENFFRELGMHTRLSEHDIGKQTIDRILKRFEQRGMTKIGMQQDIDLREAELLLESRI